PASNSGILQNHVDLFTFNNARHGSEEIALYLPGGPDAGQLSAWVDPAGSLNGTSISPPSPMLLPTGSWFCLALHVTTAQNGSLQFDLDQTQSGPQPTRTQLEDGADSIGVGLLYVDPAMSTGVSEIYVDDVAVSMSPLSCH